MSFHLKLQRRSNTTGLYYNENGVYSFQTYITVTNSEREFSINIIHVYRVAQNKIPHQTICNISAIGGLILKIIEAA